ncbi:MAG: riboflavin biosynthesis protein RibF, partial [Actinobacteria bacterium]|nr:riboflavin biosynthesis protein RibF [Actinomycetota bacterium]NIS33514.1 riboflavin biosynthesis protein RibF [Actinomycetota bacterium]NIU68397.1 riboflavin biosynthesis protein RibF [Actinomycetota bacterium]NIV89806.1 riboflavin biosynthesis protein RibF [Actinomycetota bacterium]NIW30221.1 riboflavin biosynthesis protein RibF [Actinomycetota bacterium]
MSTPDATAGGLSPGGEGAAITVGTFDGLHRGHWAVFDSVCEEAAAKGLVSVLVTFDPHPLAIVRPEAAPRLLTTPDEKKETLTLSGLDYAVFLKFTRSLSRYLPEEFVRDVLLARFGLRELVVGYDHGFGRDRSGGPDTLRRLGERLGFGVHVVPPVHMDGQPISSTRIREALAEGDVEMARRGLGRPYSLEGVVVHGEGRGRTLGFATANLAVGQGDKLLPREGIYAVRAAARSHLGPGLLHLGPRPTFRGSPPSIELHLLDFEGDLYGEPMRVEFLARLRDVRPFGSAEELVEQM